MSILTRNEFKQWVIDHIPNGSSLAEDNSPLWNPQTKNGTCEWFVNVRPIDFHLRFRPDGRGDAKGKYWAWCNQVLKGELRCFLSNSDDKIEWWGFTDRNDIPIWLLKWV